MFGLIKKFLLALFGIKKNSQPNAKGARPNGQPERSGRGRHGKRGRQAQQNNRKVQANGTPDNRAAGNSHNTQGRHPDGNGRTSGKGRPGRTSDRGRSEKGRSFDKGRSDRMRPVNTAANEMRPGGVISEEEMAKRTVEHASWSLDSFQVEPVEGKKRFHDFDLPSEVMHGIADLGFKYCTDIQSLSLQHALEGKNVAGKAQTGSGKTAAFLVAILTRYLRTPDQRAQAGGCPRALVIAPTRELVIQICEDAAALGKYCALRSLAIYGGMDMERQREELLGAPVDLLVATPGRLLDFCNQRVIDLSKVDTLVIDEADRMLDMGFIPDVRRIMGRLPPKDRRATMLYSATLTSSVMELASQWMDTPVKAEVEGEHNATDTVRQVVYVVRSEDKFKVLFNHVALHPDARVIVFCNRKSTTDDVYESLKCRGVACEMLSGDVNQNRRLKVLEDFREGKIKIVVATDVAGRGIHVDDVEYVVNFDFPYEPEDYVHRIGRTGRAGNTGIAISFADEDESFAIPDIEAYIKEPLKCTIIQDDDPLMKALPARHTQLGDVDEVAKQAVDAREAVTEEQKRAARALVGMAVKNAAGREGVVEMREDLPPRPTPTFEKALEPKAPVRDEQQIYSEPIVQKTRFEEWKIEGNEGTQNG